MIVLLDVDGTLVDYSGRLPASAATAVRAAGENGHLVYLCTGRARSEIHPWLWELGVNGLIGGNGSYVESAGEVLRHQVLKPEVVDRAVSILLELGIDFFLECNHALYGTHGLPAAIAALRPGGATPDNVAWARNGFGDMVFGRIQGAGLNAAWRTDCNKISFLLSPAAPLDALAVEFAGEASVDTWSLTGARPEFGEIGQIGVNKGRAVELLAARLGADRTDLIGFGDARSDIELLRACGIGVAMGQAPDELKAVATLVTDHVDADGLARAFERLGLLLSPRA